MALLNSTSHRPLVYAGLHGDKDTFRAGFAVMGTPFVQIGARPALGGWVDAATGVFRDSCFVQPDLNGRPLFCHFCGRHRTDDEARAAAAPSAIMSAEGRPWRLWPYDGRRGYMRGEVRAWTDRRPSARGGETGARAECASVWAIPATTTPSGGCCPAVVRGAAHTP